MANLRVALPLVFILGTCSLLPQPAEAWIRQNYYAKICPNVENIVREAVIKKMQQTFVTIPATIRLFFHDCFVEGCDASIMISSPNNDAEKDNVINLSLAGDGFDTVIKAKAAVDAVPRCKGKVSCADILVMAARDAIFLSGGPFYPVELGRLDGLVSSKWRVTGNLPPPTANLDQLNAMFGKHGLNMADMIALSACHTVGFGHCRTFSNRLYGSPMDPTLNKGYAFRLMGICPRNVDPRIAVPNDPVTPNVFDNQYFKNLRKGMGLFQSDQVLYTDGRSRPLVDDWAFNKEHFNQALVTAMTKLGRVGVKTSFRDGNIRRDCTRLH